MKFLSLCAGIDAATVALAGLGWSAVAFSEVAPFPCAVLAHHYPHIPNLGDMTRWREWPEELLLEVEAVLGGTPCQAFSVAGLRGSLEDERGNLTLIYALIIDHIDALRARHGRPPVVFLWENVPGVLSTADNAFGCLLGKLAGESLPLTPPGGRWTNAGHVRGPARAVAWRSFDAQYFGLAQRRQRVFVVGSARPGFRPEAVLFEPEGLRRDSPPRRKAGQGTAPTLSARTQGGGGLGTDFDCDGGLVSTLDASFGRLQGCSGQDSNHGHSHLVAAYRTTGNCGAWDTGDKVDTLSTGTDPNSHILAFNLRGREGGAMPEADPDGLACHPLASEGHPPSLAFTIHGTDKTASVASETETAGCIRTKPPGSIENSSTTVALTTAVRRLTPRECERLQGFPDDYTLIPWRGKAPDLCPDGPRYKALGNSWAVPVVTWIGKRIDAELSLTHAA